MSPGSSLASLAPARWISSPNWRVHVPGHGIGHLLAFRRPTARFAAYLGLDADPIGLRAQIIGGLLAALGGGIEMLGLYRRFSWQALPGNGWTGVTVAILARDHPGLIIPATLFLGWLQVGGDLMARNFDVPNEAVGLIRALLLVAMTAAALTRNPRLLKALGAVGRGTRHE